MTVTSFLIKVGAFCNFAFGCIFVLSALCGLSGKLPESSDNNRSLNKYLNKTAK